MQKRRRVLSERNKAVDFSKVFNEPALSDCKLIRLPERPLRPKEGDGSEAAMDLDEDATATQAREELWVSRAILCGAQHGRFPLSSLSSRLSFSSFIL